MEFRLDQLQSQVQKPIITIMMSPQMQQAIKLLQLPILELSQKIEEELLQNPVLEEVSTEEPTTSELEEQPETPAESPTKEVSFDEEFDTLAKLDDDWRDFFRQTAPYNRRSQEDEEKRAFIESSITRSESLEESLTHQMTIAAKNEEEKNLGLFIIGHIDENGFLTADVDDLSRLSGNSPEDIERVLEIIQGFEPNGVGARDLRESLLIQLRNLSKGDSLAYQVIENHFTELAKRKFPKIARDLGVSVEDVQACVEEIAKLTRRPGRLVGPENTQYIVPDIVLRSDDGDFEIVVNDDRVPHLRISDFYRKMMADGNLAPKVKEYIKDKIHAGRWLIKNIYQRQQTLYNITQEIVSVQKRFLASSGSTGMRPLTMHQIAEVVNLHESTVSRAIANKYIETPRGLFPLKYFFTTAIETSDGGEVSSRQVKHLVKEFVEKEDSKKPLSDELLVKLVNARGMKIARRTIAKYRKELGILPSHLRKQF
ncbi:RNA polymerase factor sigma-54 [bacterium]|nr:RNA polymerase factor sigma-54 [bacterium]